MRTVVLDRDVLEGEVKPHALLDEYRRLLEEDVAERLVEGGNLVPRDCPGCGKTKGTEAFTRSQLMYLYCDNCRSIYLSPCPVEGDLADFYRNSKSSLFWREKLLPATREVRRVKLFQPRVQWLLDVVDEYCPSAHRAVAVGYHNELLIEELCRIESLPIHIVVTNPVADIEFANIALPRTEVRPNPIDELEELEETDLFFAFDILDRCSDPNKLIETAAAKLSLGGLLMGTTTLGSGFDIQVLWDKAESIYLPDRLNLFSSEGLIMLFERHGFEVLEFSTPGMFDAEVVRDAIVAHPDADWPRFIRYLVEVRGDEILESLQEFLQRYRLSSFSRFVLRKAD
jgi:hypothetical protein